MRARVKNTKAEDQTFLPPLNICSKRGFSSLATGRNFVLSLVLSLARGPRLHKQYFVRADDMHASELLPLHLIPIICYYLPSVSSVLSGCQMQSDMFDNCDLKIHDIC